MNASPLVILRETQLFVAIAKPAGLPTTAPLQFESVEERLRSQLTDADYLTAVHRLDRDVSGILLLAKTKKSARLLSEQFASRKVKKTYYAWVHKQACDLPARYSDYLCKIDNEARGRVCDPDDPTAKLAETEAELVRNHAIHDCSLLRLFPITGRMHQLRLQTSHRGHPIVNDPIYGPDPSPASPIALLAAAIEFHDPKSGIRTKVAVTNPETFFDGYWVS